MALIKCPECGKEISDKADVCIGCGFPINKYTKSEEEKLEPYTKCPNCDYHNEIGVFTCKNCGYKYKLGNDYEIIYPNHRNDSGFNGIYKYTLFGGKQEVYCPRCGSENCSHYQEQKIIPGKTKTRYTANLNPLRPFTLMNKKEKVVRKEEVVTENKFLCNDCGKIFK